MAEGVNTVSTIRLCGSMLLAIQELSMTSRPANRFAGVVTGIAFTAVATAAHADAIDGDWCNTAGQHLEITGPTIVTPGGTSMKGDYDRHAFRYTAPQGEEHAGAELRMRLFSDDDMEMVLPDGSRVPWRRCELTS
jgi:hypothetical protein